MQRDTEKILDLDPNNKKINENSCNIQRAPLKYMNILILGFSSCVHKS